MERRGPTPLRRAAFAGQWYPAAPDALAAAVDRCLAAHPAIAGVTALIAPHAGLVYSGPVAGYGYAAVAGAACDVVVLVGPSHYAPFDGVALSARGGFDSPLGALRIDEALADRLAILSSAIHVDPGVHDREHSLELQLPFLARVLPDVPILPLMMGSQDAATSSALAEALATALRGRQPLLVASSDLSHYQDRGTASALDAVVLEHVRAFDPDALQAALDRHPNHACGGGPIVAVMRAARALGATRSAVLRYADSGDVSGDTAQVVGYVSAAFGAFEVDERDTVGR
jgi:AmmeMemoRadiSam system protein B